MVEKELEEVSELFRSLTGRELSPYWRAPYGEYNREILQWAYEKGYVHIGWTTEGNGKWRADGQASCFIARPTDAERNQ